VQAEELERIRRAYHIEHKSIRMIANAKSRDLLGNGGAGGKASLPGFGVSPNFPFP